VELSTASLSRVLETVKLFRKGKASFSDFLDALPDVTDPDLDQLEDLLEHEPRLGGLFSVDEQTWKKYQAKITAVIERLEARLHALPPDSYAG
jgi:hypothetical protein